MAKSKLLLAIGILMSGFLLAGPGDTTKIQVHDETDMTWYVRYKEKALFPSLGTDYHRINMKFTLGCATGGCSDWDYTVLIRVLHRTGAIDSTFSIDTISTNPIVIDTTWTPFDVIEPFEIGRMITPYGGYMARGDFGYDNSWEHEYIYDVTDYESILRDSVEIEVFYQGWSAGFSADLKFEMIEGVPARNVSKIQNVYPQGGFSFRNTNTVEANNLVPVDIQFEPTTQYAALHILPTGHGFDNAPNCAEFCERDYFVKIDGQTLFTQSMWRDDCGLNPIFPQGGTWIYDRANWCPGTKAWTYEHNISPYITGGQTQEIDVDLEPYTVSANDPQAPSYNWSTILLEFDGYAHQNDVELMEIISPSTHDEYTRINPACGNAILTIRNKGAQPLTSCVIEYGYENATIHSYTWQGNLGMMESEQVELSLGGPGDWQQSQPSNRFIARVSMPNGVQDEYALNDASVSHFEPTPIHAGNLRLNIRTNGAGSDTWWELKDHMGTVVNSGDGYNNYQFVNEDLNLTPGCYHLQVHDRSKNGLDFAWNNDGNGFVRLYEQGVNTPIKTFLPNFGTQIDYWFSVGIGLGADEIEMNSGLFGVQPNPAQSQLEIFWKDGSEQAEVKVIDVSGRQVLNLNAEGIGGAIIDVNQLPRGVYLLQAITSNGSFHRERIVLH